MTVEENPLLVLQIGMNVGGNVYVPPAACLRPAFSSAYIAAYVERTGNTKTNNMQMRGPISLPSANTLFLELH